MPPADDSCGYCRKSSAAYLAVFSCSDRHLYNKSCRQDNVPMGTGRLASTSWSLWRYPCSGVFLINGKPFLSFPYVRSSYSI